MSRVREASHTNGYCVGCDCELNIGEEYMDYCWRCRRFAAQFDYELEALIWRLTGALPPHFNYQFSDEGENLQRYYYLIVREDDGTYMDAIVMKPSRTNV